MRNVGKQKPVQLSIQEEKTVNRFLTAQKRNANKIIENSHQVYTLHFTESSEWLVGAKRRGIFFFKKDDHVMPECFAAKKGYNGGVVLWTKTYTSLASAFKKKTSLMFTKNVRRHLKSFCFLSEFIS